MFSFIHSSDLHLGKPFGRFGEDLRVRLREARHQKISRLATEARRTGASHVLLAGDTFDAETPPPQILRQAIRAFAEEKDIIWVLLPGNHDSLLATELWARFEKERPENVVLALQEGATELAPGVELLAAPCPVRHAGRDLTEWMDRAETRHGALRLGLAHGPIQGFSEEDAPRDIIAPDRAERARLDYLALGDWHGRLAVSPKCHYPGAPEADSFKHGRTSCALHVVLTASGAAPNVTEIETGELSWIGLDLDFRPGDDPRKRLEAALPAAAGRRDTLVRLAARGRLSLAERASLDHAIVDLADDFGSFEVDLDRLDLDHETADLDEIDMRGGALRTAAARLLAGAEDMDADAETRRVRKAALARLYSYALAARG
ncbi:MAG: metallophosphoesterase [Rhodobacteraceae bacterium]|nr:metallophosphoesterase [Paracoccaceae bacterium]